MKKEMQDQLANTDAYVSMAIGLAIVLLIGGLIFNFFTKGRNQQLTDSAAPTPTKSQADTDTVGATITKPGTHIVKAGETLWSIAMDYYQSGYKYSDIASANNLTNPSALTAGQTLVIPTRTPETPAIPTATSQPVTEVTSPTPGGQISAAYTDVPAPNTYTVVHGDNLWKIAKANYGNGARWTDIAKANHLTNPRLIHAGNVLILP